MADETDEDAAAEPVREPQPCAENINRAFKALPANTRDNPKMQLRAMWPVVAAHVDTLHRQMLVLSETTAWLLELAKAEVCHDCQLTLRESLAAGKCWYAFHPGDCPPGVGMGEDDMCAWLRARHPSVLEEQRRARIAEKENDGEPESAKAVESESGAP